MIGVLGKVEVEYLYNEKTIIETFEIVGKEFFILKYFPTIKFDIEEVCYIEDTIYSLVISHGEDDFIVSGSEKKPFEIKHLKGTFRLKTL